MTADHGITGCSTYNPLVDPTEKIRNTDLAPVKFINFTGMNYMCPSYEFHFPIHYVIGYKNKHANAHFRSTTVEVHGYKGADSLNGVMFIRNMHNGYQLFQDAIIVGNSPNKGVGGKLKVAVQAGKTHDQTIKQHFL